MNEGGVRWIRFSDDLPGWLITNQPGMRHVAVENRGFPLIKNIRMAPSLDRPARPDMRDDDVVLASHCFSDEALILELIYDFVVARYGLRMSKFNDDTGGQFEQCPAAWEHPESSALEAIASFYEATELKWNKAVGNPLDYILETAVSDNKVRERNYKGYGDWA